MISEILRIAAFSFLAWCFASFNINWIKDYKKSHRVAIHYLGEVIIFGSVFYVYFSLFEPTFTTFYTIITCLLSLFVFEMAAWKWYYKQVPWYYGYLHWWLPSYLVSGAIYGVSQLF
ncbi:MAG: hypothetical protein P1V18_00650 [Candidatus Gracilibacteria bacterium]|nr:hypothetical protein [Candidatus Gracilibacteria bacterium]